MVLEAVAYTPFNHLTRLLVRESFIEVGSYRTTYHRRTLQLIDSFCDQEDFITHPTLPSRLLSSRDSALPETSFPIHNRYSRCGYKGTEKRWEIGLPRWDRKLYERENKYKFIWSVLGLGLCCINNYITVGKIPGELIQGGRTVYSQIHNPINLSNILKNSFNNGRFRSCVCVWRVTHVIIIEENQLHTNLMSVNVN